MNSRYGGMCRSWEVSSQDGNFEIHDKILQLINSLYKNIWPFQISDKIDSHVGDMDFHIHDGIPLKNFVLRSLFEW